MNTIVGWFELSLALPFFGIEMKTDLSLVAIAEFSKFAGILSEELLQLHLLGFEIAGISSPLLAFVIVMFPKAA